MEDSHKSPGLVFKKYENEQYDQYLNFKKLGFGSSGGKILFFFFLSN